MTSTTTVPAAVDHGSDIQIASIHPDIIQTHILNRLDGPTLASTGCAAAQFSALCSDDHLWKNICNSTWPSTTDPRVLEAISAFPSGHRSFYSDAFPALRHHHAPKKITRRVPDTREFISAVDIHYDDKLIYSKVFTTETLSCWFHTSPFQLDLFGPKEKFGTCIAHDEDAEQRLHISWIIIDPVKNRAFNVASKKPVESRRHWLTEEMQLRYATVVATGGGEMVQCAVVVTCGGKGGGEMHIREVSMQVEDMEGKILMGVDSMVILHEAMEGQRRKSDNKFEKDIYEMFLRRKGEDRERKEKKEKNLDVACIAAGVILFFVIWKLFFSG